MRRPVARNLGIAAAVAFLGALLALFAWQYRAPRAERMRPIEPAAPPELAKFGETFRAGVRALERKEADEAIARLSSFSLGDRPVEQYRLYYLAQAYRLAGRDDEARVTLARLWRNDPTLVAYAQVAFSLAELYDAAGSFRRAADAWWRVANRTGDDATAAAARQAYLQARFRTGDVGAILHAATALVVENPTSDEAAFAEAVLRSLRGLPPDEAPPLTATERVRRAEALLDAAMPKPAFEQLEGIETAALPISYRPRLLLARGRALLRIGRYTESDTIVEPLFGSYYKYAIPALEISLANQRALADIAAKKGDAKGKAEAERHEALYLERLRDLRGLPLTREQRRQVLIDLVEWAREEERETLLRQYVRELVETDPDNDSALQDFWDAAWKAYEKDRFERAADLFNFIASTYTNPNIQRQATYWYARALERRGETGEARRIFEELAAAPYEDLYAMFARQRLGGTAPPPGPAPAPRQSWEEIAERDMPGELRLAWELSALGLHRDARAEVQRNATLENRKWADSILGDGYFVEGAYQLAYRYLRRGWPELATPEQNAVPWRFLEMYYPIRYEEEIREAAADNGLDPYLLMALIRQESAFNPDARSHAGAIGLMQLMPATGLELGNRLYTSFSEARLSNPEVNIELGSHYLRRVIRLLDGNVELALAGYNGGPYRVRRWRQQERKEPLDEFIEGMPLSETRNYVKRVVLLRSSYRQLYGPSRQSVVLGR
ncbi:MAG: transglycosylase SLT domain-containing protein [Thermoanaerobaculia bacterium]